MMRVSGFQCHHHGLDDLLDRFGQCLGNLALGNFLFLGNTIGDWEKDGIAHDF